MQRKDPFVPENYYHIYNRGIDKRVIFKSPNDFKRFALLLHVARSEEAIRLDDLINKSHKSYQEISEIKIKKPLVSIGAWCLMTNHFHLLLREEKKGGISRFMKKLGTGYSMYFNIKYQRTGSLFGGPFKSQYIREDLHLRHLFGYVHLNSLDVKFSGWENLINKKHPEEWKEFLASYPYSSYVDYLGVTRQEGNMLSKSAFPLYFEEDNSFKDFIDSYLSFQPDEK